MRALFFFSAYQSKNREAKALQVINSHGFRKRVGGLEHTCLNLVDLFSEYLQSGLAQFSQVSS